MFCFFSLCSGLLPFYDSLSIISLEWFWEENQPFTVHWTLCGQKHGAGPSPMGTGKVLAPPQSDLGPHPKECALDLTLKHSRC